MRKKIILLLISITLLSPKTYAKGSPADAASVGASAVFFSLATIVAIYAWKNKKTEPQPMLTQGEVKNPLLDSDIQALTRVHPTNSFRNEPPAKSLLTRPQRPSILVICEERERCQRALQPGAVE